MAHSAERGFVMLLPTTAIIIAGALAVGASFLVAAALPERSVKCLITWRWEIARVPLPPKAATQAVSACILLALLGIGFAGSTDPLKNLLPLTVWVLWWIVVVLLHPLLGNLWGYLNPLGLLQAVMPGRRTFSAKMAYCPALLFFLVFCWFQLIDPEAEDPRHLARAIVGYGLITAFACFVFGAKAWFAHGDPFAPLFRFLSLFAPLARDGDGRLFLRVPGSGLVKQDPIPLAASFLVIATLSTIAFDAITPSFTWLSLIGVNPLDFPGRTAVMGPNTFGLVAFFFLLAGAIAGAVWLGWVAAERPGSFPALFGRCALSFIPISIAFHFAHFLTLLLVNGQYLLAALAALFGGGQAHVTTSFLNTAHGAWTIFAVQTVAIVTGHGVSVVVAHMIVAETGLPRARALRLELPLAVLMVAFTGLSLWALSTPSIG